MYDEESLAALRRGQGDLRPGNLLNPGNIVDPAPLDADLAGPAAAAPAR